MTALSADELHQFMHDVQGDIDCRPRRAVAWEVFLPPGLSLGLAGLCFSSRFSI